MRLTPTSRAVTTNPILHCIAQLNGKSDEYMMERQQRNKCIYYFAREAGEIRRIDNIEQPMSLTLDEIKELIAYAEESGDYYVTSRTPPKPQNRKKEQKE